MILFGVLINGIEAALGGVLGVVLRRWIKKDMGDFLIVGQGLCVVLIAIQGMQGGSAVIVTLSMALGSAAQLAANKAGRLLDKAASKGVIHKNQAAQRKSGVAKLANTL